LVDTKLPPAVTLKGAVALFANVCPAQNLIEVSKEPSVDKPTPPPLDENR
jgi:hypothetical protein